MDATSSDAVAAGERHTRAVLETFDAWAHVLREYRPRDSAADADGVPPTLGDAQAPVDPPTLVDPPALAIASLPMRAQPASPATAGSITPVAAPSPATAAAPPSPQPPALDETPLFRPLLRSPMALVHVIDDGRDGGETVRVRGDRCVIGRHEGDIVVPHDILMAARHAAIERMPDGHWQLVDLGGGGGTFVRVTRARLRDGSELLVGATRLQFRVIDLTEAWLIQRSPREVAAGAPPGAGRRHECHAPITTVGRAGHGCTVELDDPFVSPVHAELLCRPRGWQVRNAGVNGLWVRIDGPVRLGEPSQFQCGEQRFVFESLR
jgi:pSer/pThr/pTyr-binding forkhead associated (FHA) protein